MITYNKLVRDKIPEIIEADGKSYDAYVADEITYKKFLFEKLKEEVEELIEEPCVNEIADVLEVVDAIRDLYGFSNEEILTMKKNKHLTRGGFEQRIILERVYKKEQV